MKRILNKYRNMPPPAKASIWFVICNVIQKSMYFVMIPIYTRILSTEEYGIYSVFASWVTLIVTFAGLNLAGNSYNVGMVKHEDDQERYTSTMQGLWWANTTLWLIIGVLLKNLWVKYTGLSFVVLIAIFCDIYATGAFDLWSSRQKFNYNYKKLVIITASVAIMTPLISVPFVVYSTDKAMAAIWCKVGVFALFSTSVAIANIIKGKALFDLHYWKHAMSFNIPLIAYYLSLTILSQSDRIMIGSVCGTDKAGIYSIAYSLAMVLTMLNSAVNSAFIPWEFKSIKKGETNGIKKTANLVLVLIAILNLILIAVAPEIIHFFTTEEYYSSIWAVPPVAMSSYFMCMYQFFVNIEFYYEENKFVMIASISVAALNIFLNALFIPVFGFIAAAYTTLVSYICFTLAHYIFMIRTCNRTGADKKIYNIKCFAFISGGMIVLSVIFLTLYNYVIVRYAILSIFALAATIVFISPRMRKSLNDLLVK